MAAYRWFLVDEAAIAFGALSPRQRLIVFRHLESIASSPEQTADFETHIGRKDFVKTKKFGHWRIQWWVDGPVREIHILEIAKASR